MNERRIITRRLELQAVTAETAAAVVEGSESLARALQVRVPDDWPPRVAGDDGAMARTGFAFVRDRLTDDPTLVGWWGWFVLLKSGPAMLIGAVSPKGPPDSEGTVEVSYGIVASCQGRGYATEVTTALMEWVKRHPRTRRIIAETFPDMAASIAVMRKCGLSFIGAGSEAGTVRYGDDVASSR